MSDAPDNKASVEQPAKVPQRKRVTKSDWKTLDFAEPRTSSWLVPLPDGALPTLLQGYRPEAMEDKHFVYCEGPDDKGHASLNLIRSWTGFPIAKVSITVPLENGVPVESGEGARFSQIVYETSQERWDYEGIGLGNLATAQGFVFNVCGAWVFDIKFPKPIWLEVQERFAKAKSEYCDIIREQQETPEQG